MDSGTLKEAVLGFGAHAVRIADLALLDGIRTEPADLLAPYTRAVSIAVRLSDGVMDAIVDRPTPLYSQHYQKVNARLDQIALDTADFLERQGARAAPLPASQVLDTGDFHSYLSHKAVAVAAGIGWQGKSLLTISPEFGPRIRLVTVLTDLDLAADERLKNRCGSCTKCADACPAGAIKGASTDWHYQSRDEALHFERCVTKVRKEFAELEHVVKGICGVCVSVCPWGAKKKRKHKDV